MKTRCSEHTSFKKKILYLRTAMELPAATVVLLPDLATSASCLDSGVAKADGPTTAAAPTILGPRRYHHRRHPRHRAARPTVPAPAVSLPPSVPPATPTPTLDTPARYPPHPSPSGTCFTCGAALALHLSIGRNPANHSHQICLTTSKTLRTPVPWDPPNWAACIPKTRSRSFVHTKAVGS